MLHSINYDFYNTYQNDNEFNKIFNLRKKYIRDKYKLNCSDEEIIKEYFVEIFSWTAFDKNLLNEISDVIDLHVPEATIIDPCSGNSFHTFIFKKFASKNVITIDIQPEENAWIETISSDGLSYLRNIDSHKKLVLLLSWIDYTNFELPYNLLKSYKGNLVISIGNYRPGHCKKYLDELKNSYSLVSSYDCVMPWNLTEEIRVFKRKDL